ncbi:glycosyltransferase [Tropicibacter naphthalenivorans]|uniref:N-acetylgalactosamine-N, N'-diacetylbacillosaminyl-diphospho-undecaprenol 4-alpha-N-acetylgalactosaminyltransferase n=1 Tax=Tropicibacter naphthalenivorans TaxID=441103 RepID=A0A0P1GJN4_9RHOB|nr:glycosyltransferase [Tropicibacter naphthalenivorans]CUH74958.1 N-acetylgalactosamine-N, N'-diacetylbacillosaminyl-diphospho-undecaprenol 4-alpha-N-acetylgalactosaminyltransferase [Tropicibacter naphthalenivorans]SMC47815.1 Glycosyltransferase involved in cell wall bisynthesis [Tropicibacter naphthalenivorans]
MPDLTIGFCVTHLETGGIERNTVQLLGPLRDRGIRTVLFLQAAHGELLSALPEGQEVVDLGGKRMLGTARALARALRDHPVDLLYTATNALNISALLAARMMARPPQILVGEHFPLGSFLATRKSAALRLAVMRMFYPGAVGFVAPSQPILDEHQQILGRRCPPTYVLPNPVIQEVLPARTQPDRARRIVSLGRLSPDKDFALALRAFAVLLRSDPEAQFTIYGQGAERDNLIALTRELGIEANVSMPGVTRDVPKALAEADLYLCSSYAEGFGNAVLEAQAAGMPVVSVDCPIGPRILLEDGKSGCLVESRDPEVLGAALTQFAADPKARHTAALNAREFAKGYSIDASADAHAALFRKLANA